jgi:hypothetical protein
MILTINFRDRHVDFEAGPTLWESRVNLLFVVALGSFRCCLRRDPIVQVGKSLRSESKSGNSFPDYPTRLIGRPLSYVGTTDKYPTLSISNQVSSHNVGHARNSCISPGLMAPLLIPHLPLLSIATRQCAGAEIGGNVEMVDSLGRLWGTPCSDIGCTSPQVWSSRANCAK